MSKRTEELKIRISPEDKERIKLKMDNGDTRFYIHFTIPLF